MPFILNWFPNSFLVPKFPDYGGPFPHYTNGESRLESNSYSGDEDLDKTDKNINS